MTELTHGRKETLVDMRSLGATGLKRNGGYIREEYLPQLTGTRAADLYQEMGDTDPVCGGILYAIDILARGVGWRVEPASGRAEDREAADFLETCMYDMQTSWIDTISEVLGFIRFGHSVHEIVYKRRGGPSEARWLRSKYADGRIGWRDLPIRSANTIVRWVFDPAGNLEAVVQQAPPTYAETIIPMDRCILFRKSVQKGSPEGQSIFRPAYRSYWLKKNIENIESIGVERDLAGLPCMWVPQSILSDSATAEEKAILARIEAIGKGIRRDEQECLIMPLAYDDQGHSMYDVKLLSSGGTRQFNTSEIVQRYDHRIAMSALADFLLMGQNSSSTGSFAMHQDKTGMFGRALNAYLDGVSETLDGAVAKLFELNTFDISEHPRIVHDNIEQIDVEKMGRYIQSLSAAGMPIFPNPTIEKFLYEVAGIPRPPDGEAAVSVSQRVAEPEGMRGELREIVDPADAGCEPQQGSPDLDALTLAALGA
ncbi:MAG: hypothetical protein EOP64_00170 [Sphingomonas sp.]|nr:MAG: hypothetical protein EOP64_00170 [Sphingomonas sp.]